LINPIGYINNLVSSLNIRWFNCRTALVKTPTICQAGGKLGAL